jgi:hypothetical protein
VLLLTLIGCAYCLLCLLRHMQLMQAADSIATVSTDVDTSDSTVQAPQQQPQQQQQPVEQERFTVATLRKLLRSPECISTLRRIGSATVEQLAGEACGEWSRMPAVEYGRGLLSARQQCDGGGTGR